MIIVLTFEITTDYTGYPNWLTGRRIVVSLDEGTFALSVEIKNGSGTVLESPVTGPPLFSGVNGMVTQVTPLPLYQWCDGTTLRKINVLNTFPYASIGDFPNNVACQIAPVCDLEISNTYTITEATGPSDADGGFVVTATSSNGTIRYSLDSYFDYTTEGNTTGIFTGLLPGTYTVYAKDSVGCQDSVSIVVPVTTVYEVRFRGEYDCINEFHTRIDILERGYDGELSEVCFSETPLILSYEDSDRYTTFIASRAVIKLLEETEDQFTDLFTDDDRKYLVKIYKDLGAGFVLKWVGYIVPSFYQQSFVRMTNNFVEVIASDQIGTLKQEPFVDSNGNNFRGDTKQLFAITEILKKTGLNLNIRSADNIFETQMDVTDADDPLDQAYFDPRIFYNKTVPDKCNDVLEFLLNCKSGLRLFQSDALWWLVRSEVGVGSFSYREFDSDGVYVSDGIFNPVLNRVVPSITSGVPTEDGVFWIEETQQKSFGQNYGYFDLTHNLNFDDNLIDEGAFEEEDIIDLGNGNKAFKNWNTQAVQTGLRYGLEYVENKDSKGAFFADFDSVTGEQADNAHYSFDIPIESNVYGDSNLIKFSFEYMVVPQYFLPWIRIAWQLKLTNTISLVETYLQPNKQWSETNDKNEIYVSNFNKFEKFEITAPLTSVIQTSPGVVRISFFFHNHYGRDYDSIADLQADATASITVGKKLIVNDTGLSYFYELEYSQSAEDLPSVVHGSDFNSFTNAKVWSLKGIYQIGQFSSLVNRILFDNVKFSYIPYNPLTSRNYSPPTEASYQIETSQFVKNNYEETFKLGDLPDLANAKNLYRGWLRLSDGTPTALWQRRGMSEEVKLLSLALSDRAVQLSEPPEIIEASIKMTGVFCAFVNAISYDGFRYLITKYALDDKQNKVALVMSRMGVGSDGEPPANFGEYSDLEYDNTEYNTD